MLSIDLDRNEKKSFFSRASHIFDSISGYLIVFGLAGGGIANVLLYYLGTHGTALRAPLFIFTAVVIFCLACVRFLQIYISDPQCRRLLLLSLIFPVCGLLIFAVAFATFGKIADGSIDLLMQFGCFCIPAFIFGLDCALNQRELTLFKTLDVVAVFYVPFVIFCISAIFSPNNVYGILASMGDFNYMSIAYVLLLPLSFLTVCFVLLPDRLFLSINADSFRIISSILCFGLALLLWYVILCTGTRGPIVCVFAGIVFLIMWTAFIRKKRSFIRSVVVFLTFTLVFILLMFIIKSDYTSSASGRMQYFVDNLFQGKFKTSSTEAVAQADLDRIINNNEPLDPSKIVMNREQLYYAAILEFLKSPVYGMGPLGFYAKYDGYVHNIFLEVMCDYGIIGALLFFGTVFFWLLVRLIRLSINNMVICSMLILLVFMNLPLLFSATFLTWPPFWFFLGYAQLISKYKNKGRQCTVNNG